METWRVREKGGIAFVSCFHYVVLATSIQWFAFTLFSIGRTHAKDRLLNY